MNLDSKVMKRCHLLMTMALLCTDRLFAEPGSFKTIVNPGVVVERSESLQTGDTLLSWEPAPIAFNSAFKGSEQINSISDWIWLVAEQDSLGPLRLKVRRGKTNFTYTPTSSISTLQVRPAFSGDFLTYYLSGRALIESKDIVGGTKVWSWLAELASINKEPRVSAWLYLQIGEAWLDQNTAKNALVEIERGISVAGHSFMLPILTEKLGAIHERNNDLSLAEKAYKTALDIHVIHKNGVGVARCKTQLAILAWKKNDLVQAEQLLSEALTLQQGIAPISRVTAFIVNNLGIISWLRGMPTLAREHYLRALEIREIADPKSLNTLNTAGLLANLGVAEWSLGNLDVAEKHHLRALEIQETIAPDTLYPAGSYSNLGVVALSRGDLDAAARYHQHSFAIRQRIAPNSIDTAISLNNLGTVLQKKGDLDAALGYFDASRSLKEKLAPKSLDLAMTLSNLGQVAFLMEQHDLAASYHERALEIRRHLAPESIFVADSSISLGNIEAARGNFHRAFHHYNTALQIRRKSSPKSEAIAGSLQNLGSLFLQQGDLHSAEEYLQRAKSMWEDLAPGSLNLAETLSTLAEISSRSNNLDAAIQLNLSALSIREKQAPGSLGHAKSLNELGRLHRRNRQDKTAEEYYARSLNVLQDQNTKIRSSEEGRSRIKARYLYFHHDYVDLLVEHQRLADAFAVLEGSRAQILLASIQNRELADNRRVPEELIAARNRIASTYDQLKSELANETRTERKQEIQNDLNSLLEDEDRVNRAIGLRTPNVSMSPSVDLYSVQKLFDKGILALYFSVGESQTYLFALTSTGLANFQIIQISESKLRSQVNTFLELLHSVRMTKSAVELHRLDSLRKVSGKLYDLLIGPISGLLPEHSRLLIIPDGPLHVLPWAALAQGNTGNKSDSSIYLGEQKPISVNLSITLFSEMKARRIHHGSRKVDADIAVFGDILHLGSQSGGSEAFLDVAAFVAARKGRRFAPLPATRLEAIQIADLFPGKARSFLGPEATEERAKLLPRDIPIVHFATHAILDERLPLHSAVVLSSPQILEEGKDNGLLQAWEIFERVRIDADLVVLSACESGLGKEMGGEGLIGLTRAFQYAGARSVMASLWKISDRTTAELMVRFYKHLKAGKPKDEALRAAQMELIRGPIQVKNEKGEIEEIDASAPYYWAAFQIYGDWQ